MQLQCCGVDGYMDYQEIFNNFSVPVSCCNTTSPLANETCTEIVMDVNDFENEIAIFSEVEWSDYAYAFKCMCNQTNTIIIIGSHQKKISITY